mmetsp:Transcript_1676/g.2467  ORF Transcript_1676/g.2467 Transcript_1676/m.2467 type:complete len:767 (-) Transcript_1676:96-2396(-)
MTARQVLQSKFYFALLGLMGAALLFQNLPYAIVGDFTKQSTSLEVALESFVEEHHCGIDEKKIDNSTLSIILIRAIGNPMPPRHDPEQAFNNLDFTLKHEQDFAGIEKHWVLNRLVNETLLNRLVQLLESNGKKYTIIPFDLSEYEKLNYNFSLYEPFDDPIHSMDYMLNINQFMVRFLDDAVTNDKNLYVTNQNEARNLMIDIGIKSSADWIFPWDGNCFLHPKAYHEFQKELCSLPKGTKYAITPMNRAIHNDDVLKEDYKPKMNEEPQVILHRTAKARFNPLMRYGRRNKVEFIQRIKAKGFWDQGIQWLPWEKSVMPNLDEPVSDLKAPTKPIGFTTRLTSGDLKVLEEKLFVQKRGKWRVKALNKLLGDMDTRVAIELYGYRPGELIFYDEAALAKDRKLYREGDTLLKAMVDKLLTDANSALDAGPWSVVHKPKISSALGREPNDYYSLAPFYWPVGKSGWEHRKGENYPGTILHDNESHKYDRTRLNDMQRNTTILALAYFMTGEDKYGVVAARNVRTWFIDNSTSMSPHLLYANVWNNTGHSGGIIEMKDLYFMLDAVRLLERQGFLSKEEQTKLRSWFETYLNWIETSNQGMEAYCLTTNAHGVFYDVQAVAIAAYINDTAKAIFYIERSFSRMKKYIITFDSSPKSYSTSHGHLFALHGWFTLARMAEHLHRYLWTWHSKHQKSGLCRIAEVPLENSKWLPLFHDKLYFCSQHHEPKIAVEANKGFHGGNAYGNSEVKENFAPFWNFGLKHAVVII